MFVSRGYFLQNQFFFLKILEAVRAYCIRLLQVATRSVLYFEYSQRGLLLVEYCSSMFSNIEFEKTLSS